MRGSIARAGAEVFMRAAQARAGSLAAAAASISVGLVPALATQLFHSGISVISLLFWRYAIALCIMVALAIGTGRRVNLRNGSWLRIIVFAAVIGTLQTYCFYNALKQLPSSILMMLFFTFPVVTVLIEYFLWRSLPPRVSALAIACVVVGAMLVVIQGIHIGTVTLSGLLWAIPVPTLYSVYLLGSARLLVKQPAVIGASLLYAGLLACYSVAVVSQGLYIPDSIQDWIRICGIALFGGVFSVILFSYGLPRLGASHYGIIASLELITVLSAGSLLLGERLTVIQWVGASLVLMGVLLRSYVKPSVYDASGPTQR